MAGAKFNLEGRVFHIRRTVTVSSPSEAPVASLSDSALVEIECCADVYRGLARLCRCGSRQPRAVVVCTDDLSTSEMEFFAIVARTIPGLDVYAYGSHESKARVARALELGAAGELTDAVVEMLARSCGGVTAGTDAHPGTSVDSTNREACRDAPGSVRGPVGADADPLNDDYRDSGETNSERSTRPARVPWRAYGDRPVRTAPSPPTVRCDDAKDGKATIDPYEPLLTKEELEALIHDDGDSIESDEQTDVPREDSRRHGEMP